MTIKIYYKNHKNVLKCFSTEEIEKNAIFLLSETVTEFNSLGLDLVDFKIIHCHLRISSEILGDKFEAKNQEEFFKILIYEETVKLIEDIMRTTELALK